MAITRRGKTYGVSVYERGKRRWVGTYRTAKEAREAEATAVLERHTGGRVTVGQFASTWLARYPRPKRSTEIHYAERIRRLVADFGGTQLRDLQRSPLRVWAIENPHAAAVARAMLGDAQRDGLIAANPLANLRLPSSRGRRDLVVPTAGEVVGLAECAVTVHGVYGDVMYAPMILLAAHTGLRPGELHGLRWEDVDTRTETLTVRRQFSPKTATFTAPKNGKARTVALIPAALAAVERIARTKQREVFTAKQGGHFSGRVSHYYWHPVRCAFGRPDWDFYSFRHYFGTLLALQGVGAPEIAQAMGHSDGGKLALERYIHVGEAQARDRIRRAFGQQPMPLLQSVRSEDAA